MEKRAPDAEGPRLQVSTLALLLASVGVVAVFLGCMLAATEGHFVPQVVDLYVVLQYAKAMAEGHPFQYNPGEAPTSGSTSLLHTALLAVGHASGVRGEGLVAFAIALGVGFFVASVVLARRVGEALAGAREGFLAAGLVAFGGPVVWGYLYGSDIALYMFLALWVLERWLVLWRTGQGRGFALAGGLFALARPEALVMVLVLGLAASWHRREPTGRASRLVPLVPAGAGVVALFAQRVLAGSWLGTSVSGKSLLPNYGWADSLGLAAQYGVDVVRGLLLGLYPSESPIGFSRGYGAFQFPPLGLVFVLLLLALPARAVSAPLRIWAATVGLLFAFVGPNLFMGVHFNRYLMWAFPGLLCLVAAGLGEATRLVARDDSHLERSLFGAGAGLFLVLGLLSTLRFADFYGQMAGDIYRREVPTADWIRRNLPPGVAIANVATSIEYLTGHRNVNLHGVTSPHFVGNRLVEKEAGIYEALVSFPEAERPPYLLVGRSGHEASALWRELTDGPPLFESLSLGDEIQIYRTRYDVVGRNTSLHDPDAVAAVAGLSLVDRLNVCDTRDEAAHDYEYSSRRGDIHLAGALKIDGYPAPVNSKPVADAGRAILGHERFFVRSTPGRDLVVVLRTHGSVEARSMRSVGAGGFGSNSYAIAFPEEGLVINAGGVLAARLSLRPRPGWNEFVFRIPASLVKEGRTRIGITGRYASFFYWFYQ